jgi:hypothetical protein
MGDVAVPPLTHATINAKCIYFSLPTALFEGRYWTATLTD